MEQFPLLDIVIGLSLIYTFLSLLSSELTKLVVTVSQWKARSLKRGIMILLGESLEQSNNPEQFKDTITGRLYAIANMTAIVQYLDRHHATRFHLPAQLFADALLDVLQNLPDAPLSPTTAQTPLATLLSKIECSSEVSPQLQVNLKRLIDRSQRIEPDPQQQIAQLKQEIALWFNHSMRGLSTVYRHNLKAVSFLVSLTLAVALNADSLYVIRRISENTATRAIIIQNATRIEDCRTGLNSSRCIEQMSSLMESSTVPIGWHRTNRQNQFSQRTGGSLLRAIGGWLLTGIAVSMGSRFWLQLLNRCVNPWRGDSPNKGTARRSVRLSTRKLVG